MVIATRPEGLLPGSCAPGLVYFVRDLTSTHVFGPHFDMHTRKIIFGLLASVTGGLAWAGIDLSDFDDDLMRNMDDAIKSLDSSIATKEAQTATADAQFIAEGLKWTEGYFAQKGNVADAVQWAKQGQELAAIVVTASAQNDFDAAFTAYRTLVKTCRSCHDAYKPPSL